MPAFPALKPALSTLAAANWPRVLKLFVLPNLVFLALWSWLQPPQLIVALNAALLALATGVVISFIADAIRTVLSRQPMRKVHWLVLGITTHWVGTDGTRMWSIIWRWAGQPLWMADSWPVAYCLFLSTVGAYFHLASSEAMGEERIPRAKWVRYGILAAAGIIAIMVAGVVVERLTQAEYLIKGFG